MNLSQKAFHGLNLTPGERAVLKLLQGFLLAGVQSLLLAVPTVLSLKADQPILAAGGIGAMIGAFVHGFMVAWQKYVSAKGDQPLAMAIGAVDAAVEARLDAHYPEIPASDPASASSASANSVPSVPSSTSTSTGSSAAAAG